MRGISPKLAGELGYNKPEVFPLRCGDLLVGGMSRIYDFIEEQEDTGQELPKWDLKGDKKRASVTPIQILEVSLYGVGRIYFEIMLADRKLKQRVTDKVRSIFSRAKPDKRVRRIMISPPLPQGT